MKKNKITILLIIIIIALISYIIYKNIKPKLEEIKTENIEIK
jgi:uncharacterized membrane protein